MCIKRWLVLPSDRDGEEQKAFGKTEDRHACMCTFLYEAMAQDDKLNEKSKLLGKMAANSEQYVFQREHL